MTEKSDLIIVGAGPAGCTLALKFAPSGRPVTILEKETGPREKICGDAVSGKVGSILKRLPGNIYRRFLEEVPKIPSHGIRFTAPDLSHTDVAFPTYSADSEESPGYICRRSVFDRFLFDRMKDYPNIRIVEGARVTGIEETDSEVIVTAGSDRYTGQVVAGADGAHSVVRKSVFPGTSDQQHFCVGIRAYFKGVTGMHPDHFIELLFLKEVLPAYFWIFPSTGGLVNAGFGMPRSMITSKKINLSTLLRDLLATHPLLAPRFKNAVMTDKPQAHSLPLGSLALPRSGNRKLLLGDAAFLVDPFTGEGIGNAMASGEVAAEVLASCFEKNDLSADALKAYDARIQRRLGNDFRITTIMQRLARHPYLINLVVGKSRKNPEVNALLSAMFLNEDIKGKLTRPGFYARLILK